jgi:hypothetical protein
MNLNRSVLCSAEACSRCFDGIRAWNQRKSLVRSVAVGLKNGGNSCGDIANRDCRANDDGATGVAQSASNGSCIELAESRLRRTKSTMRIVDTRGERTRDETRAFLKTICLPPEDMRARQRRAFSQKLMKISIVIGNGMRLKVIRSLGSCQ